MYSLVLVGLLGPEDLTTSFPTVAGLFAQAPEVYWAFVQRQDHDIPVGTTFQAQGKARDGQLVTNRYRLVAVTQQYGIPMAELPHGWNAICAFQVLSSASCLLAELPTVSGWYEQEAVTLVLIAEQAI
jgi:hypothetical protein